MMMGRPGPIRAVIIVLDGVGAGAMPDAAEYGDAGSNTLANIARAAGGLRLDNMARMGLGRILPIDGVPAASAPEGSFGIMMEGSKGKDTITGHWELAGVRLDVPFNTYPHGFPREVMDRFEQLIGAGTLGNRAASGTEIIEELGEEHLRTGYPIVYTSADSVFQVAAHESKVPVADLYSMCEKARGILVGEHLVARVIARPFVGQPGRFKRTAGRRDFSVKPPAPTLLDCAKNSGRTVVGIGKIEDIFAGSGISRSVHTSLNSEAVEAIRGVLRGELGPWDIIMANLVDFDMVYGHRNNPGGFAQALEDFDGELPGLVDALGLDDMLVLTADHGCDPTTPSTDHSREYVPLLVYGKRLSRGTDLGLRKTFADVAESVAGYLSLPCGGFGTSFMPLVER